MSDPIGLQDLFFGTMAGAAIVMAGAFYALFFALGRLHSSGVLAAAAIASYVVLTAAVVVLIDALGLSGFWIVVTSVMLIGYFLLPRAIWQLCVSTHGDTAADVARGQQND